LKSYWTISLLRKSQDEFHYLCKTFRCLQLLNNHFESLFRDYLFPLKVIVGRIANSVTFVIIRYYNHPSMPVVANFFFFSLSSSTLLVFVSILELFGKSHIASQKCINSWKTVGHYRHFKLLFKNQKYFTKFAKSCKPITFHLGSFEMIRRKSALNFLKSVTRTTVRLLIAI
jgi:hypothetical protein